MLGNPYSGAFGLKIGDLSIKLVQLRPGPFYNRRCLDIKETRTISLPPGLIIDGEIQQPELVRKKLLLLLGREGSLYKPIGSTWVAANLPEPKTFLKLLEIEACAKELTTADVEYHAKKHLPFDMEQTYLDWQIIKAADNVSLVLLGAVQKNISDTLTFLLESAGLNPIALEIESVALARSMITADKDYKNEARSILDLGATCSSLIIYDNKSIQFSKILKFSGEAITDALEQGLKIKRHAAEELKIKNGLKYDSANSKYLPIVSSLGENLISELKEAFAFYKNHFPDVNPINHITMCGGVSNWLELDNFISRKLKISAHPGHPWKNLMNKDLYNYEPEKSLPLASAIGLALRAAQNTIPPTNNNY